SVRLVGSSVSGTGRVEVLHNGYWGTVCTEGWGLKAAMVTCQMLGYKGASLSSCQGNCGRGQGPIWLSGLQCQGTEASLAECSHNGWGKHKCDHSMDAGGPSTWTSSPVPEVKTPIVRLTNGSTPTEGRVELLYGNQWGTVCDDNWGIPDADVICHMLGLPGAVKAVTAGHYGAGSLPMGLDEVGCHGNESDIWDCASDGWGKHDCAPNEAAGVVC
ncbi:predicted protein, partial [Nematostella vectensis]